MDIDILKGELTSLYRIRELIDRYESELKGLNKDFDARKKYIIDQMTELFHEQGIKSIDIGPVKAILMVRERARVLNGQDRVIMDWLYEQGDDTVVKPKANTDELEKVLERVAERDGCSAKDIISMELYNIVEIYQDKTIAFRKVKEKVNEQNRQTN